jgi:hypothetical protein
MPGLEYHPGPVVPMHTMIGMMHESKRIPDIQTFIDCPKDGYNQLALLPVSVVGPIHEVSGKPIEELESWYGQTVQQLINNTYSEYDRNLVARMRPVDSEKLDALRSSIEPAEDVFGEYEHVLDMTDGSVEYSIAVSPCALGTATLRLVSGAIYPDLEGLNDNDLERHATIQAIKLNIAERAGLIDAETAQAIGLSYVEAVGKRASRVSVKASLRQQ